MNSVLSDEEIRRIAHATNYDYPYEEFNEINWDETDIAASRAIVEAEHQATLKAVGKWLEKYHRNYPHEPVLFGVPQEEFEALKEGGLSLTMNRPSPITEHQFHMVWTQAVGRPGYNKGLFAELLNDMILSGQVIPTGQNCTTKQRRRN